MAEMKIAFILFDLDLIYTSLLGFFFGSQKFYLTFRFNNLMASYYIIKDTLKIPHGILDKIPSTILL